MEPFDPNSDQPPPEPVGGRRAPGRLRDTRATRDQRGIREAALSRSKFRNRLGGNPDWVKDVLSGLRDLGANVSDLGEWYGNMAGRFTMQQYNDWKEHVMPQYNAQLARGAAARKMLGRFGKAMVNPNVIGVPK